MKFYFIIQDTVKNRYYKSLIAVSDNRDSSKLVLVETELSEKETREALGITKDQLGTPATGHRVSRFNGPRLEVDKTAQEVQDLIKQVKEASSRGLLLDPRWLLYQQN